ncbi:transposable element Tcb2 transposase [Trichonephila clavipes]|nr:transposable element Tcb2 transposase [Trichonephila clavipes]
MCLDIYDMDLNYPLRGRPVSNLDLPRIPFNALRSVQLTETVSGYGFHREKAWKNSPRATTAREDRYLSIIARCNKNATASYLSHAATRTRVLRLTVSRRLHERGLFAGSPVLCVPLCSANKRVRLKWCRGH